jgi:hypothetical protein
MKKFKHRGSFIPKATLHATIAYWKQKAAIGVDASIRADTLAEDNKRLVNKVAADSFLIDELKKQIAQQHVQLCNIRETRNERQITAAQADAYRRQNNYYATTQRFPDIDNDNDRDRSPSPL